MRLFLLHLFCSRHSILFRRSIIVPPAVNQWKFAKQDNSVNGREVLSHKLWKITQMAGKFNIHMNARTQGFPAEQCSEYKTISTWAMGGSPQPWSWITIFFLAPVLVETNYGITGTPTRLVVLEMLWPRHLTITIWPFVKVTAFYQVKFKNWLFSCCLIHTTLWQVPF